MLPRRERRVVRVVDRGGGDERGPTGRGGWTAQRRETASLSGGAARLRPRGGRRLLLPARRTAEGRPSTSTPRPSRHGSSSRVRSPAFRSGRRPSSRSVGRPPRCCRRPAARPGLGGEWSAPGRHDHREGPAAGRAAAGRGHRRGAAGAGAGSGSGRADPRRRGAGRGGGGGGDRSGTGAFRDGLLDDLGRVHGEISGLLERTTYGRTRRWAPATPPPRPYRMARPSSRPSRPRSPRTTSGPPSASQGAQGTCSGGLGQLCRLRRSPLPPWAVASRVPASPKRRSDGLQAGQARPAAPGAVTGLGGGRGGKAGLEGRDGATVGGTGRRHHGDRPGLAVG